MSTKIVTNEPIVVTRVKGGKHVWDCTAEGWEPVKSLELEADKLPEGTTIVVTFPKMDEKTA